MDKELVVGGLFVGLIGTQIIADSFNISIALVMALYVGFAVLAIGTYIILEEL